jgi:regulator of protease activity HflC (stomatin/prohibitin superfamily)
MRYFWLLILLAVMLSGCGFEIIPTGHRGVETRFGKIVGESLLEGLYFYNPLTSDIVELDVREQVWKDHTPAYTKDVQQVEVEFVLNYAPQADKIHLIYQEVGSDWANRLLSQVILAEIKNTIGRHEALNLVENRSAAIRQAEASIIEAAAARRIRVTRFEITNFDFSDEFERAVEAKVTAEQEAAKQKNITVSIQEQARQKVIAAQAEAESIRIRTVALKQSPALIQYEAVQKWDGKLPTYMLGGVMPFLPIK